MASPRWTRCAATVVVACCHLAFGDASNETSTATATATTSVSQVSRFLSLTATTTTNTGLFSSVTQSNTLTAKTTTTTSFFSGVTPSDGNVTFHVGEDVYSLHTVKYGSGARIVPAGTAGVIKSMGPPAVVHWAAPHNFLGEVRSQSLELAPCFDSCDGLASYMRTSSEVKSNAKLARAEQCLGLQNHSNAAACAVALPRKTRCQNSWNVVQGHAESCTAVGVNITMLKNETATVFQPILKQVIAIVSLSYTLNGVMIDIPAGTSGHIIERGERIIVKWDVPGASSLNAVVTATQIEYATCMAACKGMQEFFQYEKQFREVLGEDQLCLAIKAYENASTCVFAARSYSECSTLRSLLGSAARCSNFGGTKDFVDTTFASSSPRPYTSITLSPSGTTTTRLVAAPFSRTGLGSNQTGSGDQFNKAIAVSGTQKMQTPICRLIYFLGLLPTLALLMASNSRI